MRTAPMIMYFLLMLFSVSEACIWNSYMRTAPMIMYFLLMLFSVSEACIYLSEQWYEGNCDNKLFFICQKEIAGILGQDAFVKYHLLAVKLIKTRSGSVLTGLIPPRQQIQVFSKVGQSLGQGH